MEFTLVEEMRSAMQNDIFRRKDLDATFAGYRSCSLQ